MTLPHEKIIITPTYQEKNQGILVDFKIKNLQREKAEKGKEKTRHPIVSLILKNKKGDFLVIEKTKKSHEKRLYGTKSIFFGEHLLSHLHKTDSLNLNLSLLKKHVTEDLIEEELSNFKIKLTDNYPRFLILANKSSVDCSHIGFIFEGLLLEKPKHFFSDGTEKIYAFESLSKIFKKKKEFNYWSQLIINYLRSN
jgi:predicted NUDIX family phosphoesterase